VNPDRGGLRREAGKDSPWFALDADAVLQRLGSTAEGLSSADAAARVARHGANVLPRARGDSALDLLWRQIDSPLIWVLIASGAIAMVVDPTDGVGSGLVILAVVLLNTLIGFLQEWKAGRAIEALGAARRQQADDPRGGAGAWRRGDARQWRSRTRRSAAVGLPQSARGRSCAHRGECAGPQVRGTGGRRRRGGGRPLLHAFRRNDGDGWHRNRGRGRDRS
jgi:hypothetical protein